ncbi:MAG: nickel-dependent hydrogenase large subunit [Nostocoides sp.]
MSRRFALQEVIDPNQATVVVERDAQGNTGDVRFDLSGLPRVDALLVGRPIGEVPGLVERVCGLCPAAHHLAGIRALEALAGAPAIPETALAIRRLLHLGSAVQVHAERAVMSRSPEAADAAAALRFAAQVKAAAGSPGHFPATAIPGGVSAAVSPEHLDQLSSALNTILDASLAAAEAALSRPAADDTFTGWNASLCDASGVPDLLGDHLKVARPGEVFAVIGPAEADDLIAEEIPGASAPRPYLAALGPMAGRYRVGPVAQLHIGPLGTPAARALQERWLDHGGADAARAVMAVHVLESVDQLLGRSALTGERLVTDVQIHDGVGVGWVDGPRGLLIHRYQCTSGTLTSSAILTPTAQNEPWLAGLLGAVPINQDSLADLEGAIREADPCLPCSSAPPGGMGLIVQHRDVVASEGA